MTQRVCTVLGITAALLALSIASVFGGGTQEVAVDEEAVEIWIPAGSGPVDDWDEDPILAVVEEQTGTSITIRNMDSEGFMDSLTAAIAGANLPDIVGIVGTGELGTLQRWAEDGVIAPFEGAVAEAAPNVLRQYEVNPQLTEITIDDTVYFQPVSWGDETYPNMGLLHIREDLVEEFGMDLPETFDEYFEYLERAKAEGHGRVVFPGNEGLGQAITSFSGAYGIASQGWVPVDGGYEYYAVQPETLDALLLFREMMERDLVSPSSWEFDGDAARGAYVAGDASALIFNGGGHTGRIQNDMELVDDSMQNYLLPALRHETEQRGYTAEPQFWGFSFLGGMDHNNPVGGARVLNFLTSEEGYRLTAIGVEGIDHVVHDDGEIELLPERRERGFPTEAGDTGAHPLATHIVSWVPQEWQDFQLLYGRSDEYRDWYEAMWENQGRYQVESFGLLITSPSWRDFQATSHDLVAEAFLEIVNAPSEAQAEAAFDSFVEQWYAAGGEVSTQEMSEKLSDLY